MMVVPPFKFVAKIMKHSIISNQVNAAIMPECPHCNAHFESWFPLKQHMYHDSLECKEKERKYQQHIYNQQLARQNPLYFGSPPVTP